MSNEERILALLDALTSQFQEFRQDTGQRFDSLEQAYASIEQRLGNLEQTYASMEQRLGNLEQTYASMEQRLGNLEQAYASMEQRLGNLEQTYASMEQRLGNLEQAYASMEQRLGELQRGQSRLERDMVTKEEFDRANAEGQKDILAMLQLIDQKLNTRNEQINAKFEVVNHRLFTQETEVQLLKSKVAP